jgi:hypothetical protein
MEIKRESDKRCIDELRGIKKGRDDMNVHCTHCTYAWGDSPRSILNRKRPELRLRTGKDTVTAHQVRHAI